MPEDLAEVPDLMSGLEAYFEDYTTLAKFSGGDVIKLSEVFAFADSTGMSEEYLDDLLSYIPELDAVRLKYLRQKAKDEANQK